MKVFYSDAHYQHGPPFEAFDGGVPVPYLETPKRMERILSVLRATGRRIHNHATLGENIALLLKALA